MQTAVSGCSTGNLTLTLRNYLPNRVPVYAAPFGSLATLRKECINIGCAYKPTYRFSGGVRPRHEYCAETYLAIAVAVVFGMYALLVQQ